MAILGAGVAGLATALNLEDGAKSSGLDLPLTVFEGSADVGGKLSTIRQDGYVVEEGPNGWLDNEPATARLIERLGLGAGVIRSEDASRHRFLLSKGRLEELPLSPLAFVRSGLLSAGSKLRVAAEPFVRPRKNHPRGLDDPSMDETVFEFGERRLGREFAEALLDPMVKGIFGGDARRLSLAATFPRMVELERDYGGLFKAMIKLKRQARKNGRSTGSPAGPGATLLGFAGGMETLPSRLRSALGADFKTGGAVTRVWTERDSWWVETPDGRHGPFAAVVDATPAHAGAKHHTDAELSRLLCDIPYAPMAVITLAFDRGQVGHPLNGFGMLCPSRERRRLLGVLWSTSIFKGRAPENKVVLRCMGGGSTNPEIMNLPDGRLIQVCMEELGPLYGLRGAAERSWIIRHEKAIAQYEKGHVARLNAIDEELRRLPGLYLTGSSYRGVSVNHCIAEAEKTAAAVLSGLASRGIESVGSERSEISSQPLHARAV